jgi:hypothetical protein
MQFVAQSLQHRNSMTYLIITAVSLAVQLIIALPITLHIWAVASRPGAYPWDRTDAITIPAFLVLQSAIGSFFLWRIRRTRNCLLHGLIGVLMGLCGFIVAAPLEYFILLFSYKSLLNITPLFFFILIFFLGHRIPLLGVVIASFAAGTTHWLLLQDVASTQKAE